VHFYNEDELAGRFIVDEEVKKGLPKVESLELKQGGRWVLWKKRSVGYVLGTGRSMYEKDL